MPINEGSNIISQTNCEIIIGNSHTTKNVYKKSTLMSFDFDKIKGTLIARNRLSGDKIYIGGMHKSLKKLMCDKKIPVEQRNLIPVLCDDNGIVAVPFIGVRDDVKCASKKDTKINLYFYLY
jgi:tRNA(Ile)-lysidine synthase